MVKLLRSRRPRRRLVRRKKNMMKRRGVGRPTVKRTSDYAVIVEGSEKYIQTDATGSYGLTYTTSLSDFQRAQEVAHAYKYYRCSKIELQFIPYANFATVGAAGPGRIPQIYFTVDRVANQFIQPNEAEMIERGVSPKIWTRKQVYTWKPNLLQNVQMEVGQPADGTGAPLGVNMIGAINSVPLFNKWLPTQQSFGYTGGLPNPQTGHTMVQPAINPYALRYYGAAVVIDQEFGSAQQIGDLITKVTWEFKGPRALHTNAPTPQTVVSDATSMINPGVVANTQPTNYP